MEDAKTKIKRFEPHLRALSVMASSEKRLALKEPFDSGSVAGALRSANGFGRAIEKKQIEHGKCDGCPQDRIRCVVLLVGETPFLKLCASCWERVFDMEISP